MELVRLPCVIFRHANTLNQKTRFAAPAPVGQTGTTNHVLFSPRIVRHRFSDSSERSPLPLFQVVFTQPGLQRRGHRFPTGHSERLWREVGRNYARYTPLSGILLIEPAIIGTIPAPAVKDFLTVTWSRTIGLNIDS